MQHWVRARRICAWASTCIELRKLKEEQLYQALSAQAGLDLGIPDNGEVYSCGHPRSPRRNHPPL